jgi:anti-sigma-K factor RskA
MNDRLSKQEREALLAGDRADALEAEDAAGLSLVADVLADGSTWAEPGAGLEDAVVAAVTAAEQPPETRPTPIESATRRRGPTHWRRRTLAGLAAAAAIAIVVGVVASNRGGSSPDYRAQLGATRLAPDAHASADITHTNAGFRVSLDAHGLPALPAGGYYQGWLKDAAGTLVPLGTFSSSDGRVTLWSGVSPKQFPTFTVTIEAPDGAQSSSGRVVLKGTVRAGP